MKIKSNQKSNYEVDLPNISADRQFTYYDKKLKKNVPASYIKEKGLMDSTFCYAICGLAGSGKTSLMTSLMTSKVAASKAYYGVFDRVYLNIPKESLSSLASKPFKSIPEEQLFEEFDEKFIDDFTEIVKHNTENDLESCLIIDDCVTRLKGNFHAMNKFIDFLNLRRHFRCSMIILIQDPILMPLTVRNGLNGLFIFSQINFKRYELINNEYLNMSLENFRKFIDFVWQKHGDVLYIDLRRPLKFYKNFKEIEMICDCDDIKKCKCGIYSKRIEKQKNDCGCEL